MSPPITITPAPSVGHGAEYPTPKNCMPYSCLTCARRKVKCDKLDPVCSTCVKAKADCVYQAPLPRKRKRKAPTDIHEKLKLYEDMLIRSGMLNDDLTIPKTPPKIPPDRDDSIPKPSGSGFGLSSDAKVVGEHGNRRYLDSFFYRLLQSTEQQGMWNTIQLQGRYETTADMSPLMLFGPTTRAPQREPQLGMSTVMQLWHVYIDRVEPLVKAIHRPTTLPMFTATMEDPQSASLSSQCLAWAILHFAVLSLSEVECRQIFPEQSRDQTATLFRELLQQKLQESDLLCTGDIRVLQAFVILLSSVRGIYDPKLLWVLCGVAFRLAQSMGLHRDGENLGFSHFDSEMNRRIFWQIPHLDGYSAQICGTGIMYDPSGYDVRWPGNFNDSDLNPGMTEPPRPQKKATEMMYWLAKAEMVQLYLRHREWTFLFRPRDPDYMRLVRSTIKVFDEKEDVLESKYLRYVDATEPAQLLCMLTFRAALEAQRFRLYLPYAKVDLADEEHKQHLTETGVRIIGLVAGMFQPSLMKFAWHSVDFFIWDILIWLLSELMRSPPYLTDPGVVWQKLNAVCEVHPELSSTKRAMAVALAKLAVKSWTHLYGIPNDDAPPFILRFMTMLDSVDLGSKREAGQANATLPANVELAPGGNINDTNGIGGNGEQVEFENGIESETIDWEFWDQLLRDPDLLRPLPI